MARSLVDLTKTCAAWVPGAVILGFVIPVSAQTLGQVAADETWTRIEFPPPSMFEPVVIVGVPTQRDTDPGVVRVRNVDRSGAELSFQEWDFRARDHNDHDHDRERVPYLAINAGNHELDSSLQHDLPDRAVWEAGTFEISGTQTWKRVSFEKVFYRKPKLFLTVQTANGSEVVVARAKEVTTRGFQVALFEEEALNDGHVVETVGYLAIHAPTDSGFSASSGRHIPYRLATRQLGDEWVPVIDAELRLQEERSKDLEVTHTGETVDVLDIGRGLFAQDVSSRGPDTVNLRYRRRSSTTVMAERAERLEDAFENLHGRTIGEALDHHKVAGLSIVLLKDALPAAHMMWGLQNVARDIPTSNRTIYQAASMSKFVAGAGFAAADRRGDLSLDQTVAAFGRRHSNGVIAEWIDKFFKRSPEEDYPADITVRRLLSHTAGLSKHSIGTNALPSPCDKLKAVILGNLACAPTKPIHHPGTTFDYSGGGVSVAEKMLETELRSSFTRYLERHVLTPYGLRRSTFETAHRGMEDLARGCSRRPCGNAVQSTHVKAAGGLLAHPRDYARLVRLMMHDGIDWRGGGEQVIPYSDVQAVLTPAHHRGSTLAACQSSCPDRTFVRVTLTGPITESAPQQCILNRCRDTLGNYGLGVRLRGLTAGRGNLPQRFLHGGNQKGFVSWFSANRNKGDAIVFFINGKREWGPNDRGAKALRSELKDAFRQL